jgi:D-alanine-D-alanine ligase
MAVCEARLPVLLIHNIDPAWESSEKQEAVQGAHEIESALRSLGHPVMDVPVTDADLSSRLRDFDPDKHIVLNWCEELPGVPHSGSIVAQVLTSLGFTYTGSPAEVLALTWDKAKVKHLLDQHGIANPRYRLYSSANSDGWDCFPAIVKPSREHCSFGISPASVVETPNELAEQIAAVTGTLRQPALVEEFIDGREFHVPLWGDKGGGVQMLPVAEMDFSTFKSVRDRLCTFDSKHRPGSRHYEEIQAQIPAMLDKTELRHLAETSMEVCRIFGCLDYTRLDIRLRNDTFYVLDVNPNPDITGETSFVLSAALAGYSYGAMVNHIIQLAALRHPIFSNARSLRQREF